MGKKVLFTIVTCIALLFVIIFIVQKLPVESWCQHQDIDIQTGKIRTIRYVFFYKFKAKEKDTKISLFLSNVPGETKKPEWKRVGTYGSFFYRISYYYSHTMGQMHSLTSDWFWGQFTEEAKQASALNLLLLWQLNDTDEEAAEYIQKISNITHECGAKYGAKCRIGIDDLPVIENGRIVPIID